VSVSGQRTLRTCMDPNAGLMVRLIYPQAEKAPGPTVNLCAATHTVWLVDARICRK
jgi:hypothetical protein